MADRPRPEARDWPVDQCHGYNPRFEGTVPGVYQVALKVTQHGRHVADPTTGEDVTTLDVVPPIGPQGLYVDTGLYGQGDNPSYIPFDSLRVEGRTFTYSTGGYPDNWVQLDAATLAVVASGTHNQITPTAGTITIGQWDAVDLSNVSWDPTVGGARVLRLAGVARHDARSLQLLSQRE